MTVVVTGDRITAVGKSGDVRVPHGARVVDGNGKYLIPGLWDMHVHTAGPSYLPLYAVSYPVPDLAERIRRIVTQLPLDGLGVP